MATNAVSRAPARHDLIGNRLLSLLSREERARLLPHLRQVSLSLGQVIYDPGGPLDYGYFPTTCVAPDLHDGKRIDCGDGSRRER